MISYFSVDPEPLILSPYFQNRFNLLNKKDKEENIVVFKLGLDNKSINMKDKSINMKDKSINMKDNKSINMKDKFYLFFQSLHSLHPIFVCI